MADKNLKLVGVKQGIIDRRHRKQQRNGSSGFHTDASLFDSCSFMKCM